MKVILKKRPKNPIIIEGFPGFGLVGTIATEFLIKHLDAKPIGKFWSKNITPIAAVHDSKVVEPLGIFYDNKHNIIILHAMSGVKGLEWEIADCLVELCKDLKAKELISLEGIGSPERSARSFYYTSNSKKRKAFDRLGLIPLKEGIVMGVTGALMLKFKDLSCFFVESHVSLADSKAAAEVIKILDKYLKLKIDIKPLLQAAQQFEKNLSKLVEKSKIAMERKERRRPDYLG
jgi:uncharacterized protein